MFSNVDSASPERHKGHGKMSDRTGVERTIDRILDRCSLSCAQSRERSPADAVSMQRWITMGTWRIVVVAGKVSNELQVDLE